MKRMLLFFTAFLLSYATFAQRTIQMRDIWMRPQVHVLFEGYTLSFTIKDINKALALLAATGDSSLGKTSGLDTAKDYYCELYSGVDMQYHNQLQVVIQHGVGCFLLLAGHSYIENKRHKHMQKITADIKHAAYGEGDDYMVFYDPRTHKRLFTGRMNVNMYNQDLGIE